MEKSGKRKQSTGLRTVSYSSDLETLGELVKYCNYQLVFCLSSRFFVQFALQKILMRGSSRKELTIGRLTIVVSRPFCNMVVSQTVSSSLFLP